MDDLSEETEICVKPEIEVMVKKVYGTERFYPASDDAKVVCGLMKVQTFTKEQLKFCKDSGWKITVRTEEYKLD